MRTRVRFPPPPPISSFFSGAYETPSGAGYKRATNRPLTFRPLAVSAPRSVHNSPCVRNAVSSARRRVPGIPGCGVLVRPSEAHRWQRSALSLRRSRSSLRPVYTLSAKSGAGRSASSDFRSSDSGTAPQLGAVSPGEHAARSKRHPVVDFVDAPLRPP